MTRKLLRLGMVVALALVVTPILAGTEESTSAQCRDRRMRYDGGPIMTSPINVYIIWYGGWQGHPTVEIVTDFMMRIGGSPYWNINSTYYDAAGGRVSRSVTFGGSADDGYSQGLTVTEAAVKEIVRRAVDLALLPADPNGIYLIFGSSDVVAPGVCRSCEFHKYGYVQGVEVKYGFVGNTEACPSVCEPQILSPSGNSAADAMISWAAHVLNAVATNPAGSGWFGAKGQENADLCRGKFGRTYRTANGARANVKLGDRDYLLQANWVNDLGGCAIRFPTFP